MSLNRHNFIVLQITGYLQALDLDEKYIQSIHELCNTHNIDNLTIALEMLKTLSKTEKLK